jgi:hypothetical protein
MEKQSMTTKTTTTIIAIDDNGRKFYIAQSDCSRWNFGWRPAGWNQPDRPLPANHVPAKFYIGDFEINTVYNGWHDPARRWNGWAVPKFDRQTAIAILNEYVTKAEGNTFLMATKNELQLLDEMGFLNVWPADEFGLYDVGATDWIWDTVEED